jgi:hypothetical protein
MIQFRHFAQLPILLTLLPSMASSQTTFLHRVYSNVRFIEDAGDLLGFELELNFDGSKVSGEFRNYEGACGIPTEVSGTLERGRITLKGVNKRYGKIKISGTLDDQYSRVRIRVGEGTPKNVTLRMVAKSSCREDALN